MKKKYEMPAVLVVKVHCERLITNSLTISLETVSDTEDIGFVKSNSIPNNHSVWDDDWSK
jgi:hypothetical protein